MIISKITNAVFISKLILSNDSITINDLITINGSQMPPSNQERQKIVGCYFSNSDYTHMVYIQGVRAKESKLYIAQELFVPLQPFLSTSLWRQPLLPVSCVFTEGLCFFPQMVPFQTQCCAAPFEKLIAPFEKWDNIYTVYNSSIFKWTFDDF